MKSIKPGRGPSGMSFAGSIIAVIFGIFWTAIAVSMTSGSPFGGVTLIFPLFGVLFIILGIVQAVYHYRNATGRDRYSAFDITDSSEEGDPADQWVKDRAGRSDEDNVNREDQRDRQDAWEAQNTQDGRGAWDTRNTQNAQNVQGARDADINYCPYCGAKLESGYRYCPKCGKNI